MSTQDDNKKSCGQHITEEQKNVLVNFIQQNQKMMTKKPDNSFTKNEQYKLWEQLRDLLHACAGPKKEISQWKTSWRDLKCTAKKKRSEAKKLKEKEDTGEQTEKILPLHQKVLALLEDSLAHDDSHEQTEVAYSGLAEDSLELHVPDDHSHLTIVKQEEREDDYVDPLIIEVASIVPPPAEKQQHANQLMNAVTADTLASNQDLESKLLQKFEEIVDTQVKLIAAQEKLAAAQDRVAAAQERAAAAQERTATAQERSTAALEGLMKILAQHTRRA